MKKCNWCGAEINDDAKLCSKCEAICYELSNTSNTDAETQEEKVKKENVISTILKVIGWLTIIAGIILGIYVSVELNVIRWFFIYFGTFFIVGIIFIAFGEVIRLLQEIDNKIK